MKPPPRSGVSFALAPNGKCYTFGGVMDVQEDEENLQGQFSNDLHYFDLSNPVWRFVELSGKKEKSKKKKKTGTQDVEMIDADIKSTVTTDGVFTMVVGSSKASSSVIETSDINDNRPSPRMNTGMVICKGNLYIFGGAYEEGSKQFTLCDLSSLDLHKLDEWKSIISNTVTSKDWLGSDSESGSDESDEDEDDGEDIDDDNDDSDDSSSEMDTD